MFIFSLKTRCGTAFPAQPDSFPPNPTEPLPCTCPPSSIVQLLRLRFSPAFFSSYRFPTRSPPLRPSGLATSSSCSPPCSPRTAAKSTRWFSLWPPSRSTSSRPRRSARFSSLPANLRSCRTSARWRRAWSSARRPGCSTRWRDRCARRWKSFISRFRWANCAICGAFGRRSSRTEGRNASASRAVLGFWWSAKRGSRSC